MKILSYKINFIFPFFILVVFTLSSCGNFKIVTLKDTQNKQTTQNKTENKKETKTLSSKVDKYSEFQTKAEKVVEAARQQLGTPHLDRNPEKKPAVDCSGMTCKSYAAVNVKLPPTTTAQAEMGKFVPKKDLQKGDLVFFTSKKNNGRVSHVGLISRVEDGKTFFIHTSTSRGVVEDDFYMKHWQDNFVTARRIL